MWQTCTYIHCKNRFLIQSFTLICSAVMNNIYWKLVHLAQTKIVWPKQCHAHEHACVVVLCRRDSSACMCAGIQFWRWSERACFVWIYNRQKLHPALPPADKDSFGGKNVVCLITFLNQVPTCTCTCRHTEMVVLWPVKFACGSDKFQLLFTCTSPQIY